MGKHALLWLAWMFSFALVQAVPQAILDVNVDSSQVPPRFTFFCSQQDTLAVTLYACKDATCASLFNSDSAQALTTCGNCINVACSPSGSPITFAGVLAEPGNYALSASLSSCPSGTCRSASLYFQVPREFRAVGIPEVHPAFAILLAGCVLYLMRKKKSA